MRKRRNAPKGFENKRMNDEVYTLRRQVINLIYEAKTMLRLKGIDIPRVDVRIVDRAPESRALGMAQMSGCYIWIPETTINSNYSLKFVVFHELLHAIYGIDHNETCLLMSSRIRPEVSDKQIEEVFVRYAQEATKNVECAG